MKKMLFAAVFLAACSDSPIAAPVTVPSAVGAFGLSHAAGAPLPATVFDQQIVDSTLTFRVKIVATSGSLTIDSTGHYVQKVSMDTYIDGVTNGKLVRSDHGECRRDANDLICESGFIQNVSFTAKITSDYIEVLQDLTGEGLSTTYRYRIAQQ